MNAYDHLQWTSLHHACFKGHTNIVMLLLKHGASINAQTVHNVTPLMRAIMCCKFKCVKVLLEASASISASIEHGNYSSSVQLYANIYNIIYII